MSEGLTVHSVERSRGRGRIDEKELLRLSIICNLEVQYLHDGTTGTEQHIMIHDRWLGHIENCDFCKQHVMTLILDLNKRINLFSPSMMQRLYASISTKSMKKAIDQAGIKERMKEVVT